MRTRKPARLPLDDVRAKIRALSAAMEAARKIPGFGSLSASDRQRTNRARKGGEKMIQAMINLARAKPELVPAMADTDRMEEALVFLTLVRVLQMEVNTLKSLVDDTVLTAYGDVWSDALDIYAALSRQAANDGTVTLGLQEMKVFMARNKSKARAEGSAVPKLKPAQQDPGVD